MTVSFTRRQITVDFLIINNDGGKDRLSLQDDYNIRAMILDTGMHTGASLELAISGMSMAEMNRLSFIGGYSAITNPTTHIFSDSTIVIRAGVYGAILPSVFVGKITRAHADYNAAPDTVFYVSASSHAVLGTMISTPATCRGTQPIPLILSGICARNHLSFINHGGWNQITGLTNTYAHGTILEQIERIIRTANGFWTFHPFAPTHENDEHGTNRQLIGTVSAWGPNHTNWNTTICPVISAETGMIGYPRYSPTHCQVSTLFRTDILYHTPLRIRSRYLPNSLNRNTLGAPWNGLWLPERIQHTLVSEPSEAETSGASWQTVIMCHAMTTPSS